MTTREGGPAGPDERAGLAELQAALAARSLTVRARDCVAPVLRIDAGGFALDGDSAPPLSGCVELYNGRNQVAECLVVLAAREGDLQHYEFKLWSGLSCGALRDYAPDDDGAGIAYD